MSRVAALFISRERPGFDPDWAGAVQSQARSALAGASRNVFYPNQTVSDESSLCRGLAECRAAGAEVLLVLQPTMSNGRLGAALAREWSGPVVLWATPENPANPSVSSCSLVGTHLFASILRQCGHPFELVYGAPRTPETEADLSRALQVTLAVARLRRSRIGVIGGQAPGFLNMKTDPDLLSRELGVQLRRYDLDQFLEACGDVAPAALAADLDAGRSAGIDLSALTGAELEASSRYRLALRGLATAEQLDALALRCWPELPDVVGVWPYVAVVRCLGAGLPIACEGDADGALTCLLAQQWCETPAFATDWLAHDAETITIWHGGDAPVALCMPAGSTGAPCAGHHFNNGKPGVVDACLRPGQAVTVSRLWHCDGSYHMTAFEAETVSAARPLRGCYGRLRPLRQRPSALFEQFCHAGVPHHVVVAAGPGADRFQRCARLLGIRWLAPASAGGTSSH